MFIMFIMMVSIASFGQNVQRKKEEGRKRPVKGGPGAEKKA